VIAREGFPPLLPKGKVYDLPHEPKKEREKMGISIAGPAENPSERPQTWVRGKRKKELFLPKRLVGGARTPEGRSPLGVREY